MTGASSRRSAAPGAHRARTLAGAVAVTLLLGLGGCGEEAPPGERVPELAERLDRVDEAVAKEDLARARREVEELVGLTARAEVNGDITEKQADRIVEAARELLEGLPR